MPTVNSASSSAFYSSLYRPLGHCYSTQPIVLNSLRSRYPPNSLYFPSFNSVVLLAAHVLALASRRSRAQCLESFGSRHGQIVAAHLDGDRFDSLSVPRSMALLGLRLKL
jgi:hypothetical protein